jgi:cellulose synthase/poly-beta-1,6-N-acetylglucosamine synthase-like glycosyltransferase
MSLNRGKLKWRNNSLTIIYKHYLMTTGVTSGAGTTYPAGEPEFTLVFLKFGSCCSIFSFLCSILLTIVFFFFFVLLWPLQCLSFKLQFLIAHLVSSIFFSQCHTFWNQPKLMVSYTTLSNIKVLTFIYK